MGQIDKLLKIKEYKDKGYKPLIDYQTWRIAFLNYIEELLPENINKFQRHDKTDEVFVLLKGKCILFLADGKDKIKNIYAQDMKPLKLYNVKKSVWHSHTLSKDAIVLIVENKDTSLINSPEKILTEGQQKIIIKHTDNLWEQY
ncbi:MAG: WxcM-like domain-containing protein [Halanaerobiales bacterium]|nr:WxcM-like domain-containing protein [Halanaerobiales bacterium]HKL43452.1 hypothetical protein [Clostridia bacterium]